jgi:hypothetical protein
MDRPSLTTLFLLDLSTGRFEGATIKWRTFSLKDYLNQPSIIFMANCSLPPNLPYYPFSLKKRILLTSQYTLAFWDSGWLWTTAIEYEPQSVIKNIGTTEMDKIWDFTEYGNGE